jgi:hypothetical protein
VDIGEAVHHHYVHTVMPRSSEKKVVTLYAHTIAYLREIVALPLFDSFRAVCPTMQEPHLIINQPYNINNKL